MVDIEPYQYQKTTNVKEHNDIVAKINEIVDVINNTNMDTIISRIAKIETDISGINSTDALQWQDIKSVKDDIGTITPKITKLEQDVTDINSTDAVQNTDISNLKAKDSEHDSHLGTVDTEIDGITKSLVSNVAILNGTTSGNVKVRIGREDKPSIDSNDYNIQKPTSVELVQGTAPAMVKAQITLSDGTVLISDDFMFTTEAIGQDVYISSFVFKNGNVAGAISADIGLSNGSTLEANNFVVPTDPNVTSAISDIQGRVSIVENDVSGLKTTVNGHTTSINNLNSDVSGLKTTVNSHTTSINNLNSDVSGLKTTVDGHTASINALDSDVADLQIEKADVNNSNQSIVAGSISATNITKGGVNVATVNDIPDISGKVDKAQGVSNAGKVLGIGPDGNVVPTTVSASSGEVWEEVNLSNFPTDWNENDRLKIQLKASINNIKGPTNWTTAPDNNNTDLRISSAYVNLHILEYNISRTTDAETPVDILLTAKIFGILAFTLKNNVDLNSGTIGSLKLYIFNGGGSSGNTHKSETINTSNITTYVHKMWRLKK